MTTKSQKGLLYMGDILSFIIVLLNALFVSDTRYYFYKNYRFILDAFYKVGEVFNSEYNLREVDHQYWLSKGKISS